MTNCTDSINRSAALPLQSLLGLEQKEFDALINADGNDQCLSAGDVSKFIEGARNGNFLAQSFMMKAQKLLIAHYVLQDSDAGKLAEELGKADDKRDSRISALLSHRSIDMTNFDPGSLLTGKGLWLSMLSYLAFDGDAKALANAKGHFDNIVRLCVSTDLATSTEVSTLPNAVAKGYELLPSNELSETSRLSLLKSLVAVSDPDEHKDVVLPILMNHINEKGVLELFEEVTDSLYISPEFIQSFTARDMFPANAGENVDKALYILFRRVYRLLAINNGLGNINQRPSLGIWLPERVTKGGTFIYSVIKELGFAEGNDLHALLEMAFYILSIRTDYFRGSRSSCTWKDNFDGFDVDEKMVSALLMSLQSKLATNEVPWDDSAFRIMLMVNALISMKGLERSPTMVERVPTMIKLIRAAFPNDGQADALDTFVRGAHGTCHQKAFLGILSKWAKANGVTFKRFYLP